MKIVFVTIILVMLALPVGAVEAAMQSDSYVIYESVMHAFDGPVISGVSHSVDGTTVTVTWDTNVIADSFVVYDTDNGFAASAEQGTHVKNATSHSVDVTGLLANTAYYYRVRSERINGGITTDTTERTFTTGSADGDEGEDDPPTPSGGGGGMLIIDKTDKAPPLLTNVLVSNVSAESATITWETDEDSTSFIEYGTGVAYGSVYGSWATSSNHSVTLENLESNTSFHFRAISSDGWGNVGYSNDGTFTTLLGEGEAEPEEEAVTPVEPEDVSDTLEFIQRLIPNVSLNDLANIESLDDLSRFINAPIISGEPGIEIGATEVTVTWTTDIEADSIIAVAPESAYNEGAAEPYQMLVGNSDEYTNVHEVTLHGLTPDTTYHFQLRSKARFGQTASSRDYTFRTSIEELQIVSYYTQIIDNETAIFRWVTNKEADSAVTYSPYLGGILAVDQSKTNKENAFSVIHEITITDFVAGTFYDVEIRSADAEGNVATKILPQFSTSEDDLPPMVSHIKADSTVFVDRSNKIQTIISWLTNEPATSQVYYQEGVHGPSVDLVESTKLNSNYTKEHVMVITKFKPGIVYTFRVESIDSGGNATKSKVHTFMTAKKKESIIQIIMNILENTFGWLKKIV
jgi:hypothetical protein